MKSHFNFNKQERSGIFFLLLILILLQLAYYGLKYFPHARNPNLFVVDDRGQKELDSLIALGTASQDAKRYLFNPNFISDYKGYAIGMSPEEIGRLHAFRKQNKYVNSVKEFQKITQVSDSLLAEISPYFKFPEWIKKPKPSSVVYHAEKDLVIKPKALNLATAEDLRQINGIGEKLSARIVKFRDRLGGFLVNGQLYDVYGLDKEVADRALKQFQVVNPPEIKKININTANASEISKLVYIPYALAQKIVAHRTAYGAFKSLDELQRVEGFPMDKIERIALYLSF